MHNKVFRFLVRFFLSIFIWKSERVCSLVKCLKVGDFHTTESTSNGIYYDGAGRGVAHFGMCWNWYCALPSSSVSTLFFGAKFSIPLLQRSSVLVEETALNVQLIFLLPPFAYLQKYPFYFEYKKVKQNFPHVYKIGIIYHNELSLFLSLDTH